MGTFASNLQIYAGDGSSPELHARIIEWVRKNLLGQGYQEIAPDDPSAIDRLITIGPPDRGPWISLYDDASPLTETAKSLSKELESTVANIEVHDSDVLLLNLYRGGQQVDEYNSAPDYFGEKLTKAQRAAVKGKPDEWKSLLLPGADAAQLRKVWDGKPLFAEDTLIATARLVGWDIDLILHSPEVENFEGTVCLAFQLTGQPDYRTRAEGSPRFELASYGDRQTVSEGEAFDLHLGARNLGGAATGLGVVVWGDALDDGLIEVESARVVSVGGATNVEVRFEPTQAQDGKRQVMTHVARLEDFALPEGVAASPAIQAGPSWYRQFDAVQKTMIICVIHCKAVRAGQSQVNAGLVPLSNHKGQVATRISLDIGPRSRQPAHFNTAMPGSQYLRVMERPIRLVGLASLGMDQADCAPVAVEAVERWHAIIAPLGQADYEVVLQAQAALRPQQQTIPAEKLLTSKKWERLRKGLSTCASLSAALPSGILDLYAAPIDDGSGFSFGPGIRFLTPAGATASPQLALWADLRAPGVDPDALAAALRSIVDEVMLKASGHQAFIARWDWTPRFTADMTPYEIVCGVHGQCTTLDSWCSRFLRGVSGELWLGPSLLERLGNREALEAVANLREVGQGLHLALKPGIDLGQLESALDPLLPSAQDWQAAMQQMYSNVDMGSFLKQFSQ